MIPKPIKRNENLVPVSREHHSTLLFCWKLREGVKNGTEATRILNYIDWFWDNHIQPHFKTEEELLFVDSEDQKVSQALHEHRDIEKKISALKNFKEDEFTQEVLALSELMNHHVRYEERELFPYLESSLGAQKLAAIGQALHGEQHTAAEDYGDEFWLKKK